MLKMTEENDKPPSSMTSPHEMGDVATNDETKKPQPEHGFLSSIQKLFSPKADTTLRETIEEFIEENGDETNEPSVSVHEKTLISNILNLRDVCAHDVMVPRADIVAINVNTSQEDLFDLLSERQYSRIPVYKDSLDNVLGSIHLKDIIATTSSGETVNVKELVRNVPIISPAMPVLDLLLQMRMTRKHMVYVVDEYGGIDGLITIGDIIEAIVGEIDDEHDPHLQAEIITHTDGTIVADARVNLEEFESQFGNLLSEEEREENDTLGGLVFSIAGRVPARGEVLTHETGVIFEVLDADPRRVKRLCVRNLPQSEAAE